LLSHLDGPEILEGTMTEQGEPAVAAAVRLAHQKRR
jgi:hypothetical protein